MPSLASLVTTLSDRMAAKVGSAYASVRTAMEAGLLDAVATGIRAAGHHDTRAPLTSDDSGDGYDLGDRWTDTAAHHEYVCVDATLGAAVWLQVDGGGGGGAVDSVNGQTGAVVLDYADVGADAAGAAAAVSTASIGAVPTSRTVNGHALSGNVTVTASDVGADATGTASAAVSTHVGLADPHTQYALESALAAVATSGAYADLTGAPAAGITQLTGDVTAGPGSGSQAATIAAQAVTVAKATLSATQRLFGRNTAGAGAAEEVTAAQVIDWIGSARGAVLYRGASGWVILAPGTAGQTLHTGGSGADPSWQDGAGVYGSGLDGAIDFDGASTITLANGTTIVPSGSVYTLPQDIEATTIRIRSGVRVDTGGFVVYASGLVTFDDATAILSRNGGAASGVTGGAGVSGGSLGSTSTAGAAGRATTGVGSAPSGLTQALGNRGGGGGTAGGQAGGTSGTRTVPSAANGSWRSLGFLLRGCRLYNVASWQVSNGGSGGGSGGANVGTGTASSGGGGGGGGVLVAFLRYVTGPGILEAAGGAGGNAAATGNGAAAGGGPGGGGYAALVTSSPSPSVTVRAPAGTVGTGAGGGPTGITGTAGSTVIVIV